MTVRVRNVEVDLTGPVEDWPYEALTTVIERGLVHDWLPILRSIRDDPWGPVARNVTHYLGYAHPYGVGPLLARAIARARQAAADKERRDVAARVRRFVATSGLTPTEFAQRIGTSRSRLSTYRGGTVTPSATLLLRMERVSEQRHAPGAGSVDD